MDCRRWCNYCNKGSNMLFLSQNPLMVSEHPSSIYLSAFSSNKPVNPQILLATALQTDVWQHLFQTIMNSLHPRANTTARVSYTIEAHKYF
ncbi:hypothetical protein XELAEV_18026708mg [Xenopus laevis]|uniref:Uncharacterized protein n=1 Tax=Xenopus laevis TaxID=8355 RepID=A0A974HJ97_XENLA|nr:hypothetical protein XELAEV_18026708mg [Xenopus laevis]